MQDQLVAIVAAVGALVLVFGGLAVVLVKARVVVPPARALVISRPSGRTVAFSDTLVIPLLSSAALVDLSIKNIEIRAHGREALVCKDGIKADVIAVFHVRITPTTEDVLKVVGSVGVERLASQTAVEEIFAPTFRQALTTVVAALQLDELREQRSLACDQIIEIVGADLNGFVLDQVAITHVAPVPIAQLDPDDLVDARSIRVMTERAAAENVRTAELRHTEKLQLSHLATQAAEIKARG